MRTILLCLCLALASTGCLYGAGRTSSTTTYTYDATEDKNHVVSSLTTTGSTQSVGVVMPYLVNGYDPSTGTPYGQNGYGYGNGQLCAQRRCPGQVTIIATQPATIVTYGGGQRASGTYAPSGHSAPAAEPVDIAELQERLSALEEADSRVRPALEETLLMQCRIILDNPEMIKDVKQREQLTQSCAGMLNPQ